MQIISILIAGHGRLEAAKAEGISEVPCVYADHLTKVRFVSEEGQTGAYPYRLEIYP